MSLTRLAGYQDYVLTEFFSGVKWCWPEHEAVPKIQSKSQGDGVEDKEICRHSSGKHCTNKCPHG
eukprot:3458284-Karenia_brevis.AAC.1